MSMYISGACVALTDRRVFVGGVVVGVVAFVARDISPSNE
jgi:hypothetical protein